MSSDHPVAYLLTFRSYGTWLSGDTRGWTKRFHGAALVRAPHEGIRRATQGLLMHEPTVFDARQRLIIHRTIVQISEARGWRVHAVNVRTNHVHVVLSGGAAPEQMMIALKAWSTRMLRKEGVVGDDVRVWARHGSTRYLWNDAAVVAACGYVRDQ